MAWKPKIATVAEQVKAGPRPWVAIAEDNAPEAVKLFVQVMKNQRYPIKTRMEAATRLVMIAGATFRGEKLDAQGRPAANLPGQRVTKLESSALREVLKQLPRGSVAVSPDLVAPGEKVVVFQDSNHSRQRGEDCTQAVIGKLLEQPEDAEPVSLEEKVEAAEAFIAKPANGDTKPTLKPIPPAEGPALAMLDSVWKKNE
jgi:hypothetical protein